MKKILAILISLLFVASTFGIGAIMAPPNGHVDCCSPENFHIGKTSVKVGETFTVSFNSLCISHITDEDQEDFVEWINFKIYDGDGNILESFDPKGPDWPVLPARSDIRYEWTYKAVKPGTVVFESGCEIVCEEIPCVEFALCMECHPVCQCSKTVTISSRALPMNWIMKKFGLGKEK